MYQGEVDEKGKRHGIGILTGKTYVYQGEFQHGSITGIGQLTQNDTIYQGEFKNGKRDGKGTLLLPNGISYQGIWKEGIWIQWDGDATSQSTKDSLELIFQGHDPRYEDYNFVMRKDKSYSYQPYQSLWKKLLETVTSPIIHGLFVNPRTKSEMDHNSVSLQKYKETLTSNIYSYQDSLIKMPKQYTNKSLLEAFVNLVIIKPYLQTHPLAPLIPIYGFFICPTRSNGEICPSPYFFDDEEEEERDERDNKEPYLFIIQQKSLSIPMYRWISNKSIRQVHRIFVQLFSCLYQLNQTEYQLHHNDLHGGNVLISEDGKRCWIIDWGQASFTFEQKRYSFHNELHYSSAYLEFTKLLDSIKSDSNTLEVFQWLSHLEEKIRNMYQLTYDNILDLLLDESTLGKRRSKKKKF